MTEKEEFDQIYYNEIGMCGCGQPEDVKKFIYDLIKIHNDCFCKRISFEERKAKMAELKENTDPDTIFQFVFHVLEHNKLLEHGGSVYGSWLTDQGERFFYLLSKNLSDE